MSDPLFSDTLMAMRYESADPATRAERHCNAQVARLHLLLAARTPAADASAVVLPLRAGGRR